MRTVDRQGVHIEQCQNCRGIFLDHGELEMIANAEQSYYGAAPSRFRESPPPHRGGHRDSPPPYGSHGGSYDPRYYGQHDSPPPYGGHKRRRRGFLEELFD
jgi:Zn-finger nucleic acid-binding protein